jgi:hypothetical protein
LALIISSQSEKLTILRFRIILRFHSLCQDLIKEQIFKPAKATENEIEKGEKTEPVVLLCYGVLPANRIVP